ncbi:adhesive plaque matrix protein 2 isoform X2 [Nematostella vectensis]|uniref:adhesive plaque matrix protein 2 isoform X2 n=1 Tax=Nematostella vectensis TaxID=45351 RepID=UPI002077246B|nr:adhesive plaque matrix protein 2 isoform X2 [Nematostella vectensis]
MALLLGVGWLLIITTPPVSPQIFQYFLVDNKGQNAQVLDTIKLPTCTHLDIRSGVTLRHGIKAGNFTKLGVVRDMQTCVDACCHDQLCDVAFMPGRMCYTVKCFTTKSCESIPAIPSLAANGSVQISHIVRGGGNGDDLESFKKTQGIGKYAVQKDKNQCVPSRIAYNYTLKGGKSAGNVEELGRVESVHECMEKCCDRDTCDVAFYLKDTCYSVECYADELCQSVPIKKSKTFNPTVVYMNKRNGKRLRHKDFCDPPCVHGMCTSDDNCMCDRGFEGVDCKNTTKTGFCRFSGCGVHGRCLWNDTCACAPGHYGPVCKYKRTCHPPCHNGACVNNSTENRQCQCHVGWEGPYCNISNGATIVSSRTGEQVLFTNMDQEVEKDIKIHDFPPSRQSESISALAVAIGCGVAAAIVGTAAVAFVARRILGKKSTNYELLREPIRHRM